MLNDLYFALAIHLALDNSGSEFLFQTFSAKLVKKGTAKPDTKTSNLWSTFYAQMMEVTMEYGGKSNDIYSI